MKKINSHRELLQEANNNKRVYCLLHKPGSDPSECALKNIEKASEEVSDARVLIADVSVVRDIHPNYPVNSVPSLLIFDEGDFRNVIKGCNENNYYETLFEDGIFATLQAAEGTRMKSVTVYSTPTCSWCTTLKNYLRKNRIPYSEIDVSRDQHAAEEMVRRSGQQGVPQTDIEGEFIVGFDKKRFDTLLGIGSK